LDQEENVDDENGENFDQEENVEDEKKISLKRKRKNDINEEDTDNQQVNIEDIQEINIEDYSKVYGTDLEEIMVDFDVKVFEDGDEKILSWFLREYCGPSKRFLSSEVAHVIVTQKYLGSIIKELGDTDGLGFITCLNLHHHSELECIHQIKEYITQSAPEDQTTDWSNLVNREAVGLIISERIINVPHIIAPQLNETIYEEIQWSIEDGYPFHFEDYIYVARYGLSDSETPKKKRTKFEDQSLENRNYWKIEDEIYLKESYMSFSTSVSFTEGRLFMAYKASSIPRILQQIEKTVAEGYTW